MTQPTTSSRGTDPVQTLRASVEQILLSTTTTLTDLETQLPAALSGPTWSPLLATRLAGLRATVERCQDAAAEMIDAAEHGAHAGREVRSDG